MSTAIAMPPVKRDENDTSSVSPAAPTAVAFHYTQSDNFVALLQELST